MRTIPLDLAALVATLCLACGGPAPSPGGQGSYGPAVQGQAATALQPGAAVQVSGPYQGPNGSAYYADNMGRVTFYDPSSQGLYLATADGRYHYGMDGYGNWYSFDARNQGTPVQSPPMEVWSWPAMTVLAQQLATARQAPAQPQGQWGYGQPATQGYGQPAAQGYQQPGQWAQPGQDPGSLQAVIDANNALHDASMQAYDGIYVEPTYEVYDQEGNYLYDEY